MIASPGQERMVTRVAAIVMGLLFIFTVPISPFFHENQRLELMNAQWPFLAAAAAMYAVCIATGILLIYVGVRGSPPQWFIRLSKY